jgi:hypothetical protein
MRVANGENSLPDERFISVLPKITAAAGAFVILVGALVLVGWTLSIEILKRVLPSAVAMNPTTAIAFILAGLALVFSQAHRARALHLARACGVFIALIGLLKLSAVLFGWNVGVDRLLFRSQLAIETTGQPNQMAPNTALNFLMIGCAFLLMGKRVGKNFYPTALLSAITALNSLLSIIGYGFSTRTFYTIGSYIPMALHTAVTFFVLSVGLLCAQPDAKTTRIITSESIGGLTLRRLLPAVIIVPIIIGWLRLEGEYAGLYDTALGVSLMVVGSMAVMAVLVWRNASMLHRLDIERKQAEDEREKLIKELQSALSEVKTLQGMLPICSYCKSIRNDQNFWQKVENYITERTDVMITHGICPDCYDEVVKPQMERLKKR